MRDVHPFPAAARPTLRLLRGRGQVRLPSAVRLGVGYALSTRESIYQALAWGLGTGVLNSFTLPPRARIGMLIACLLISFGISYASTIPWRWRLLPRRTPLGLMLTANGLMALLWGALLFSGSMIAGMFLVSGSRALSPAALRVAAFTAGGGFVYALVGFSIALGQDRALREQRLQKEKEKLEKLAEEARLVALRSQINPHFFFNALNTIAALIPTRPADAETAVELLATALRPVLMRDQPMLATVADELNVAEAYARIEELRFGSRCTVRFAVAPDCRPLRLPGLTLQPLLENAVRYGVAPTGLPCTIVVRGWTEDTTLHMEISNAPGSSAPPFVTEEAGELILPVPGHALHNIQERLRILFGRDARLEVRSFPAEGAALCSLSVPQTSLKPEHSQVTRRIGDSAPRPTLSAVTSS